MLKTELRQRFDAALTAARCAVNKDIALAVFERLREQVFVDRRVRVTPELRRQVLAERRAGRTISEIAAMTLLSNPTVRKVIQKGGMP